MLILNRSPVMPLSQMHNELTDMFNTLFPVSPHVATPGVVSRTAPPMNVWEQEGRYFIEAELPGYIMSDLHVSVLGDEVTIKGERQIAAQEGATYLRRERRSGSFARTWTMPAEVDADRVEASLRDGVLLITLPKSQKALPRKIEVKASKN